MNQRGPGRPRALSRERIVAGARRIADKEGLEALTVRRLAQQLEAGQASLYRYIGNSRELLVLLADDVANDLPRPRERACPRSRVLEQWMAVYDHLVQHAWASRIIAEGEYPAPSAAGFASSTIGALERAGLGPADSARAYRALWSLVLGHLLNAHPVGHACGKPGVGAQSSPSGHGGSDVVSRDDFAWALWRAVDGMLRPG